MRSVKTNVFPGRAGWYPNTLVFELILNSNAFGVSKSTIRILKKCIDYFRLQQSIRIRYLRK